MASSELTGNICLALPPGAGRPQVRATHHGDMVDNAYYRGRVRISNAA